MIQFGPCSRTQDEYARIKHDRRPCTIARLEKNNSRNRYFNVVPYDYNRIVLNPEHDPAERNDYINASLVDLSSPGVNARYIVTQGPLPHTAADFW